MGDEKDTPKGPTHGGSTGHGHWPASGPGGAQEGEAEDEGQGGQPQNPPPPQEDEPGGGVNPDPKAPKP